MDLIETLLQVDGPLVYFTLVQNASVHIMKINGSFFLYFTVLHVWVTISTILIVH